VEKSIPTTRFQEETQRFRSDRLVASRRRSSGALVFPRVAEDSPAAPDFEPVELSTSATLYSYTTIHPNPKTGEPQFTLAYADFAEGVRVLGRLQFPSEMALKIGMPLKVVVDQFHYYFVPANEVAS
jgi:uncharacterized OB-fold protein